MSPNRDAPRHTSPFPSFPIHQPAVILVFIFKILHAAIRRNDHGWLLGGGARGVTTLSAKGGRKIAYILMSEAGDAANLITYSRLSKAQTH